MENSLATLTYIESLNAFARFRRALRRSDQLILDELLIPAQQCLALTKDSEGMLTAELILMAMLLEQHKELVRLRHLLIKVHQDE
jgi:hypothetical protein